MEEAPQESEKTFRGGAGAHALGSLPAALLRYLEARGVLLSVEGQEAAQSLLQAVFRGAMAAIFGFTGWLLMMAGLVIILVTRVDWSWAQAAVAVGLVNLVCATVFAYAASRRITATPWFQHTLSELGKDRAWLAQWSDKH
ncbi:MAG TPA: phage holin family protein [Verrucomicrobiaceae bacterium]|jgi:uncharacterized membrane protein YqjE